MDWMDFNRDGKVDFSEKELGDELMCTSREEHEALFGYPGDFPSYDDEDDDYDEDDDCDENDDYDVDEDDF